MARTNGPIKVLSSDDTIPTDMEGGYAGGDSTAAAVGTSLDQSGKALNTVVNLTVTASTLDYGQPATATIGGVVPNKAIHIGIPKGMPEDTATQLALDANAAAASAANSADRAEVAEAAVFMTQDEGVATLITDDAAGASTRAALVASASPVVAKGALVQSVTEYGAVGDDVADDKAAVVAAMTAGPGVHLPRGTYRIVGDLTINADQTSLTGIGEGSHLHFVDGGLIIDGSASFRFRNVLRGIRISRTGTAGPAVWLRGGGVATGVARWAFHDVHVSGSTGQGLLVTSSYIGTFHGCYFRGCVTGIELGSDGVTPQGVNLVSFFGGEAQANDNGVKIGTSIAVNFFGFGVEGNSVSGLTVTRGARALGLYGCYFEGNGGHDVKYGDKVTTSPINYGLTMKGCFLARGTVTKDRSIILVQGHSVAIDDCVFSSYSLPPVLVDEHAPTGVRGRARGCTTDGGTDVVQVIAGTVFNDTTLGDENSRPIKGHYMAQTSLDFPSIAAGGFADLTVAVPGAALGDAATVHPTSFPEAGLIPVATAQANQVTIRLMNTGSASVDPVPRGWRVLVWKSGPNV